MISEKPAQGQRTISAGEGRGPHRIHDEEPGPTSGHIAGEERNEGAGVDSARFDDHKHDRRQAATDELRTEAIDLPNFHGD